MKSSPCQFAQLRQPCSPLSPVVNHVVTARRRLRPTTTTTCAAQTSSSAVDDEEPPCRPGPAAAADQPLPVVTSMMDADDTSQLIGDFSRPCSLPVLHGKHADLHSISPDTVTRHPSPTRTICWRYVALVVVLWRPALSASSSSSASVTALRCEPVNVHV